MEEMTRQELADRYGLTRRAIDIWLRQKQIMPVNPGKIPARFRVTEVDASRVAAGLMRPDGTIGLPPGTATVSMLAMMLGRDRFTLLQALKQPGAPQPAGCMRPRARSRRPADYYRIDEVTAWCGKAQPNPRTQALEQRIARAPAHGTEERYNGLRCICPVCQSARTATRERMQGRSDGLTRAAARFVHVALDPAADAERVATVAAALAHPLRVEMLRVVASYWPDAVRQADVMRHLRVEPERKPASHWALLLKAGLVVQDDRRSYRYVWPGRDK